MDAVQERKLIRKIKLFGSSKDADTLVKLYYDEIYYFVAKQINDKDTAYDLTQEIFISMLHSISSYQEKLASFRTWLYRIATNKIIDCRRKTVPKTIPLDDIETTEEAFFVEQIDYIESMAQKQLLFQIECYVSAFRTDIQQIFRLHIYGEQTFGEIAILIGIPEASVKSKYYRLLKQIRKEFNNEYMENIRN